MNPSRRISFRPGLRSFSKAKTCLLFVLIGLLFVQGCAKAAPPKEETPMFQYSFASREEALNLCLSNTYYFDGLTQNDLDYRMQKTGTTKEEYLAYAKEQILDFTDEDRESITRAMTKIEERMKELGYTLPNWSRSCLLKRPCRKNSALTATPTAPRSISGKSI